MIRLAAAAIIATTLVIVSVGMAHAHGTGARVLGNGAIAVELYYTDGEPMVFADVQVFGPGDTADMPHVNGRADRLGRVTFLPDRDGDWRIEGKDGEGHSIKTEVTVTEGIAPRASSTSAGRWPLWASLTLNLLAFSLGVSWWRDGGAARIRSIVSGPARR